MNVQSPARSARRSSATIKLNDFGRTIPKGHRLRLAIQNQFWFVLWPQPELFDRSRCERRLAAAPARPSAIAAR